MFVNIHVIGFTPQLVGLSASWGVLRLFLDHMRVFI